MAITTQPEILRPGETPRPRPGRAGSDLFDDANLDHLSHLLDDFIHIPGTPIRLGLDGIVGFIPGIGDVVGGIASTIIIFAAWSRGVAPVTIGRMVLNVAIETIGGALPVVGNLFDIGWKANRRNYKLLIGSLNAPRRTRSQSWLVLGATCLVLAGLMLLPTLLLGWILLHLGHLLHAPR